MLSQDPQAALDRVRAACLALPETDETISHGIPAFRVAGKMFAYFRHNHHGDDMTVVALSNLGPSEPSAIVDGIAGILDPAFAAKPPKPIADHEPKVREKLEQILEATRDGRLSPNDFAYVRAGFFPAAAKAYQEMLAGVGKPDSVTLFERDELGDDRIYVYEVRYGDKVFRVTLGLAPDDKVSGFSLRKR